MTIDELIELLKEQDQTLRVCVLGKTRDDGMARIIEVNESNMHPVSRDGFYVTLYSLFDFED